MGPHVSTGLLTLAPGTCLPSSALASATGSTSSWKLACQAAVSNTPASLTVFLSPHPLGALFFLQECYALPDSAAPCLQ
jgi:hypothetical protein